jgi:esterase/lipase superfamily enzyme
LVASGFAAITLLTAVDSASAQASDGLLRPLVEAVDREDSIRVRQVMSDPEFRAAIDATGQTAELLHSLGQAESLDRELRRDAYREAIRLGQRLIEEAADGGSRSIQSASLYELYSDYVLFLEQDYLLHRLGGVLEQNENNAPLDASSTLAVLAEISDAYSAMLALLRPCGGETVCNARETALQDQRREFRNGPLAGVIDLSGTAFLQERSGYELLGAERQYGPGVRSYGAARVEFENAAVSYGRAAALLETTRPSHPAIDRLNTRRDEVLERAVFAAGFLRERGPDQDDRDRGDVIVPSPPSPTSPPPPPPPPPLPLPVSPPQVLSENASLTVIAGAESPDLLTPYQRGCLATEQRQPRSTLVDVYYATSRQQLERPDVARDLYFGTRREAVVDDRIRLNHGRAAVSLPCNRARGEIPRPETILVFQLEPLDRVNHVNLSEVTTFSDEASWLDAINSEVAPTRRREVMVYVHGYNTSFADASYRAAQLHADLGIDGATVFYSWASRGRLLAYFTDRNTVENSAEVRALADSLVALRNSEATTVYLVAHSMGNRLMMAALEDIARRSDRLDRNFDGLVLDRRFDELVLGSADLEEDTFEGHWEHAKKLIDQATLYASSQDRAMWSARMFAGGRRIGDAAPEPLVFDKVQTFDTSELAGPGLGHDDFSTVGLPTVRATMWFDLLPEKQCTLAPSAGSSGSTYWRIRPEQAEWQSDCTGFSFAEALGVARLRGSFSEAFAWMNQTFPPPPPWRSEDTSAGRIRRVLEDLIPFRR